MKFELNEKELISANEFIKKNKDKYGKAGYITYSFTETGIGIAKKIKSSNSHKEKDITDINEW